MFVYLGSKNPAETSGRSCVNVLETSMNLYTNCKYKVYHESCYNMKMLKSSSCILKKKKWPKSDQTRK